ncbi:hypothetical protein Esti_002910 [Eimeria stiedai]
MELSSNCTIFLAARKGEAPSAAEIQKKLESPKENVKIQGVQELITAVLQGERYDKLLVTAIRFCVPCSNSQVKKLTFLFLELVDKCDAQGRLKEEIILVCNALRNDLTSPNEYVRGSALRLTAKIRQAKIIEPLVEAIVKNLTHRHSYVRRNAVLCVFALVRHFGLDFLPNATEQVDQLLLMEGDASTRRAAFLMLLHCDTKRALLYVQQQQQQQQGDTAALLGMGDQMQLALLELLRKAFRLKLPARSALLRLTITLLPSAPPSVAYEGACCVLSLGSSPAGLRAACGALCQLLLQQTEHNIKLIVLDRLSECVAKAKPGSLSDFAVDLMRGLQTNSLEVRRRILDLVRRLVSAETAGQVVGLLKKQLNKVEEEETQGVPGSARYRSLLVDALSACCCLHPSVVPLCLGCLGDFLGDSDAAVASSAALLLRRLAAKESSLRQPIVEHVVDSIRDAKHSGALRTCLWLLGEFCVAVEEVVSFVDLVFDSLSPLPLDKAETPQGVSDSQQSPKFHTRTVVLADGSYGTESVIQADAASDDKGKLLCMREAIVEGDSLLACVVAVSLTKVLLLSSPDYLQRRRRLAAKAATAAAAAEEAEEGFPKAPLDIPARQKNKSLLIVSCLFKFVQDSVGPTSDAASRCNQALKAQLALMAGDRERLRKCLCWFDGGRQQLNAAVSADAAAEGDFLQQTLPSDETPQRLVPADAQIPFRLLLPVRPGETAEETRAFDEDALLEESDQDDDWQLPQQQQQQQQETTAYYDLLPDVAVAVGERQALSETALFHQRLRGVRQMTGLADEVYVEAFVRINQFDLLLELQLVNRTAETLFNVSVELAIHGEARLVDRPGPMSLSPFASEFCRASLKLKTTEAAVLFGAVSFERKSSAGGRSYILLAELPLDMLGLIKPAPISEVDFRAKWQEFEWENKLQIATPPISVVSFLETLLRHTKMVVVGSRPSPRRTHKRGGNAAAAAAAAAGGACTPEELEATQQSLQQMREVLSLAKDCSVFSVNIYSRSVFGEDALANLSLEKLADGRLSGSVRIRSRTQGIALSVGDRITALQRKAAAEC